MKLTLKSTVAGVMLALSGQSLASTFEVVNREDVEAITTKNKLSERVLKLNAAEFDPVFQQLINTAIKEKSQSFNQYGLVQFYHDDNKSADRIESMGAEILGYIPDDTYLVKWSQSAKEKIQSSDKFRFSGNYKNAYKLNPGLWEHINRTDKSGNKNPLQVELLGFPGVSSKLLAKTAKKYAPHSIVEVTKDTKNQSYVRISLKGELKSDVLSLIQSEKVMWINRYFSEKVMNIDSVGPIQANEADISQATIWNKGITGTGQVVSVVDSGLDRNQDFFSQYNTGSGSVTKKYTNATTPETGEAGDLNSDHKVVGYYLQPGATAYDDNSTCGEDGDPTNFHGTHVAGSVAGDSGTAANSNSANYDEGDGMAPHAQILFQDIGNTSSGCLVSSDTRYETHIQANKSGAFISSNSYGSNVDDREEDAYFFSDYQVDLASYELEDMLIVVAAGNDGITALGHPGHAKNALTVGALNHGNLTSVALFSSRGPAFDGRIKPDIMAPGVAIVSAGGNLDNAVPPSQSTTDLSAKSGTSMATPTVSGGAALMRQYFMDGYYPTGAKNTVDQMKPSGALMKSVLMNGTLLINRVPDIDLGWGRIWLDNNLYFTGDSRALRLWDLPNKDGLVTGEEMRFKVNVPAGEPFRATLTWFDPPALSSVGEALVNDLDLEVRFNGQLFRGNKWFLGESVEGGEADTINTVEQFHLSSPQAGVYELIVKGTAINGHSSAQATQKQGFALVSSQGFCETSVNGTPVVNLTESDQMDPVVNVSSSGSETDFQVYKKAGGCSVSNSEYKFIGQIGSNSLSFLDENTLGGQTYGYAVKMVDACGEGAYSTCKEITSNALCSLNPTFNPATLQVSSLGDGSCSVSLSWQAGANQCQSNNPVKYNIYRSQEANFQASDETRIAFGLTDLSYVDFAVENNETYYYIVTVIDHLGNEQLNEGIRSVFTTGDQFAPGDYADDPDANTLASLDSPWQVSSNKSSTGSMSFHNAPDDSNYPSDTCAFVTLPELELQSGSPSLTYDAAYNLEINWDGVVVQISNNGGETWFDLPPDSGYPSDFSETEPTPGQPINACGFPKTQGAFNGSQNSFVSYRSDLSDYAGQKVVIRWAFSSDPGSEEEGFYLDNINVENASSPGLCTARNVNQYTSGPWYNPAESGHGFFLEVLPGQGNNPDRLNSYWYTYLDGEPRWVFGNAPIEGNSVDIEMFTTDGALSPPNFDPNDLNLIPWGDLTFDFETQTSGKITWSSSLDGFGSGSIPLNQLALMSESPKSCYSGSFSNPEQPGHGFVVEIVGAEGSESVLVSWYSYDNEGNQIWLLGQGDLNGTIANIPVSIFSGADFPPNFNASDVDGEVWGTLKLDFSESNKLNVKWQADLPGYTSGEIDTTRITLIKGQGCL